MRKHPDGGTSMRQQADDALVERDGELLGLPVVLDDDQLSALLGLPVRVHRIRYKPGRSIVAAWSAVAGSRDGWVGAYGNGDKVRKALMGADRTDAWSAVLDPQRHLVAADVLADRALSKPIAALRRRHPELLEGATLVRHNPLRRQVWRSGGLALRIGTEPVSTRHALVATLAAHDVEVLQPRRVKGVPTAEVLPWWGEGDLGGRSTPDLARSAGQTVAALHRVPLPRQGRASRPVHPGTDWLPALLDLSPSWRPRLMDLRARLEVDLRTLGRPRSVRLHGDLSADQVLVQGTRVALVDLDRAGIGPAEQDLGSFLAAAHLEGRHDLVTPFLQGYSAAGGAWDPAGLRTWQAVSLLHRAAEPFRRREDDWSRRSAALVGAAEQVLA